MRTVSTVLILLRNVRKYFNSKDSRHLLLWMHAGPCKLNKVSSQAYPVLDRQGNLDEAESLSPTTL